MKVPPLDHLPAFMTEWRSTVEKLQRCSHRSYFVSFDRSRKFPAVLNGGMRINYGGANSPRNGGCTKLLTGVIVLDWYKKTASVLPQFRMLSKISVIIM